MIDLTKISTEELLRELLRRESEDSSFELIKETPTSYTFKFYRYD
jgi:hypothetical protein